MVTSDQLKSTYTFFLLICLIAEMYAMYAYYNIYAYEVSAAAAEANILYQT